MTIDREIAAACWMLFLVYWIIQSPTQKKTAEKFKIREYLLYRILFMLGALFVIIPIETSRPVVLQMHPFLMSAVSIILAVGGLAICIWARKNLAGNWSGSIDFKAGHEIVKTGPYAFVRHPIYTGFLTMFLGWALAFFSWYAIAGFVLMFLGVLVRIKDEEGLLSKHFPQEYPEYKKTTKKLIPFIY